jgi:hypothetical protein
MSFGHWEGLGEVGRLSEAASRGKSSSASEERFSRLMFESSPSSCGARGAYFEELDLEGLDLSLEKNITMNCSRTAEHAERKSEL